MLPTLYIGDYLFVAKWPYGYSRYSFPFGFPSFDGRLFGHLPKRGDVVVFRHPGENADLIKRVIGLPGDTVEVQRRRADPQRQPVPREQLAAVRDADQRQQPVPGRRRRRRRCVGRGRRAAAIASIPPIARPCPAGRATPCSTRSTTASPTISRPITVPAGHVFLMGDNRDDSLDSRFPPTEGGIGMVPVDNLDRPRDGHLLVDRRQRVLLEAVDLVHRAARRPHRQRLYGRRRMSATSPPSSATGSATSRRTSTCSSAR